MLENDENDKNGEIQCAKQKSHKENVDADSEAQVVPLIEMNGANERQEQVNVNGIDEKVEEEASEPTESGANSEPPQLTNGANNVQPNGGESHEEDEPRESAEEKDEIMTETEQESESQPTSDELNEAEPVATIDDNEKYKEDEPDVHNQPESVELAAEIPPVAKTPPPEITSTTSNAESRKFAQSSENRYKFKLLKSTNFLNFFSWEQWTQIWRFIKELHAGKVKGNPATN